MLTWSWQGIIRIDPHWNMNVWFKYHGSPSNSCWDISHRQTLASLKPLAKNQSVCVCERGSPCHFPSSSQSFGHIQTQQRLRSDPSTGGYGHQLVAHQPGHTAAPRQKELCNGRPKRTKKSQSYDYHSLSQIFLQKSPLWSANNHKNKQI